MAANGHKVARGTVVRIDLRIQAGHLPVVTSNQVIASGFTEHTDPNALVVGPTGVGLAPNGTLYVADSSNNRIAAVPDAATRTSVLGAGGKTVAHGGKLNDPLGLTIAPGGDVVSMNGGNGDVVETTAAGRTVAPRTLVPNGAGAGPCGGVSEGAQRGPLRGALSPGAVGGCGRGCGLSAGRGAADQIAVAAGFDHDRRGHDHWLRLATAARAAAGERSASPAVALRRRLLPWSRAARSRSSTRAWTSRLVSEELNMSNPCGRYGLCVKATSAPHSRSPRLHSSMSRCGRGHGVLRRTRRGG